jgi:hypothetical protein
LYGESLMKYTGWCQNGFGAQGDGQPAASRAVFPVRVQPSHGPWGHLDAPYYISLVFLYTKYNRGRLNDSTAYG